MHSIKNFMKLIFVGCYHWQKFLTVNFLQLMVKQFGTGSNLIVPTQRCTGSIVFSFFLLHILVKAVHAFHGNTFEYFAA